MAQRIVVVDDEETSASLLRDCLARCGYDVATATSAEQAFGVIQKHRPAVVITDVEMGGMSGLELLSRVRDASPDIQVIVVTGFEDMKSAIEAMRRGAYEYLTKPLDLDELEQIVRCCIRDHADRRRMIGGEELPSVPDRTLVGHTPAMIAIFKLIGQVSGSRTPVLIRGETGSGKERIAQAIHDHSRQSDAPFVAINCSAIPETLLESELFGHARGSFTGAVSDRKGRFELAHSGTIFLDEIGDISPAFQAKLLRVLQEREFYPLGTDQPRRTEARVLAATHRDLEQMVRDGSFREDLYFRLRVLEIRVPPLRERKADIPHLVQHLLARACEEAGKDVRHVPHAVMQALMDYDWPGNVRELENVLTRAIVLARGPALSLHDVELRDQISRSTTGEDAVDPVTLEDAERVQVLRVYRQTRGNKRKTAEVLGISRPRLDRLLARFDMKAE